jgi:hypothetical protein
MRILVTLAALSPFAFGSSATSAQSPGPDGRAGKMLEAAADYVAVQDWKSAVRLIQHLLDSPEEVTAPVKRERGEVLVSVRAEAERLLRLLPRAGREAYEAAYGPSAAELLKQGRAVGDSAILAQVVRRYLYTAAGPEALRELARLEFRNGHPLHAALRYEQLLARVPPERWTPEDLYQAALSFRRAGRKAAAEATRSLLERIGEGGVRIGERRMDAQELRAALDAAKPPSADGVQLYRVNATRTNQLPGGPTSLEARWRNSMIHADVGPGATNKTIEKAEKILHDLGQPLLPEFFPVTATVQWNLDRKTLVLFRNFWGVQAVDMLTGKLEWDSASSWSLEKMLAGRDARKAKAVHEWLDIYLDRRQQPAVLFENSLVGTLSTDNNFAYAVEDFLVPPLTQDALKNMPRFPELDDFNYTVEIRDSIRHNRLQAYNLRMSGKLAWELGGVGEKNELSESFFLGPPLPLDGRLYVLNEKQQALRLICLDPHQVGKVLSVQTLGKAEQKLQDDPDRRIQAVHLAYADGILVVPTNAGAVLGVRLVDGGLAWSFDCREKSDLPAKPFVPGGVRRKERIDADERPRPPTTWKTAAPAITDGKVVFTSPGSSSVHCLRLADGTRVWTHKRREGDLYFAGVYGGKALIVGKKKCRALKLDSGEVAWELETGVPSGQGVASGNNYFLPLREGVPDGQPGIDIIDVEKGIIVAHTRSPNREVPGNLLFVEGEVVSQSVKEVTAYARLKK